jgi:hypothetical protein
MSALWKVPRRKGENRMIRIPPNQIPVLPVIDIINNESVAFGVGEQGVMIQFMERDECILIDWFDIVSFGVELLKVNPAKKEPSSEPEEIESPTVVE